MKREIKCVKLLGEMKSNPERVIEQRICQTGAWMLPKISDVMI
jgi:hypothetical protein